MEGSVIVSSLVVGVRACVCVGLNREGPELGMGPKQLGLHQL